MSVARKAVMQAILFLSLFAAALPWLAARELGAAGVTPLSIALGGLMLVPGLFLALWSIRTFVVQGHGTQSPRQPPSSLVVEGPYRLVRNPMLTGLLAVVGGEAVLLRSGGIALYVLAVGLVCQGLLIFVEEPALRRRFGAAYEAYRQGVPRWLPRLRWGA